MLNVSGRILMVNKENNGNASENLVSLILCVKLFSFCSKSDNSAFRCCIVCYWKIEREVRMNERGKEEIVRLVCLTLKSSSIHHEAIHVRMHIK